MTALRELFVVVMAVLGALLLSQVPRYVQEYEQRLGGALQEAQRLMQDVEGNARDQNLALNLYVRRLLENSDPVAQSMGQTVVRLMDRVVVLGDHASRLDGAWRLFKPLVLLRYHDREMVAATWAKFEPNLTLDLTFAPVGALLGWGLVRALAALVPRRRRATA